MQNLLSTNTRRNIWYSLSSFGLTVPLQSLHVAPDVLVPFPFFCPGRHIFRNKQKELRIIKWKNVTCFKLLWYVFSYIRSCLQSCLKHAPQENAWDTGLWYWTSTKFFTVDQINEIITYVKYIAIDGNAWRPKGHCKPKYVGKKWKQKENEKQNPKRLLCIETL